MALVRSIIQAYRVIYINVFWTRVDKKVPFLVSFYCIIILKALLMDCDLLPRKQMR